MVYPHSKVPHRRGVWPSSTRHSVVPVAGTDGRCGQPLPIRRLSACPAGRAGRDRGIVLLLRIDDAVAALNPNPQRLYVACIGLLINIDRVVQRRIVRADRLGRCQRAGGNSDFAHQTLVFCVPRRTPTRFSSRYSRPAKMVSRGAKSAGTPLGNISRRDRPKTSQFSAVSESSLQGQLDFCARRKRRRQRYVNQRECGGSLARCFPSRCASW
jgi:hypothetical protein